MVIGAQVMHSESCAKMALDRLKQDSLPPIPNNYAVYYYYYSGTSPGLRTAVDSYLLEAKALTQTQCDELFETYLGVEGEHKILQDTNDTLEKEISHVLRMIDKAAVGTDDFNESLDTFSGQLSSSNSVDQIRDAVKKVLIDTQNVAKQNQTLAAQLAETTQQLSEVRMNLDQVHRESQIDALTEVGNRKFFEREIKHVMSESRDNGWPLTLLMIDIDHFKKFNDNYGHLVGDQVLRLVARTLVENLKGRDVIARYGGEEFVILLSHTKVTDAEKVANQLRASLGTKQIKRRSTNETLGAITISVGAAEYCAGEEKDNLIARADRAMYKAKQTGRNKVVQEILTPEEIAAIKARSAPKSA